MAHSRVKLIVVLLIVLAIGCVVWAQEATPAFTPFPTQVTDPFPFPSGLFCSQATSGPGPTWRGITIGLSTLDDLQTLMMELSENYSFTDRGPRGVLFSLFTRREALENDIPVHVTACIHDNVITALSPLDAATDSPAAFLDDWIAELGVPDVLTWTSASTSRVVFWFEHGIAASVLVVEPFGAIIMPVYFPYQPVEGYMNRWPYNRTRTSPMQHHEAGTPPPSVQNPFDFDVMVATITEVPSHTPTVIPIDISMVIVFPGLDCHDIEAPFAGPTWGDIAIGSATLSDLRNYLSDLNPDYRENSAPGLQMTSFAVDSAIAEVRGIPAVIGACVNPDDERIIAIDVITPLPQIHIQDLVADFGIPDLVLWDEIFSGRIVIWLTEGIAASVSVDESEQFVPYGTITLMVYFPYQSIEGYEERWPYTHRAISKAELVTLTPDLPHNINPFDFDAMVATLTAEPDRTPTPIATPPPATP